MSQVPPVETEDTVPHLGVSGGESGGLGEGCGGCHFVYRGIQQGQILNFLKRATKICVIFPPLQISRQQICCGVKKGYSGKLPNGERVTRCKRIAEKCGGE